MVEMRRVKLKLFIFVGPLFAVPIKDDNFVANTKTYYVKCLECLSEGHESKVSSFSFKTLIIVLLTHPIENHKIEGDAFDVRESVSESITKVTSVAVY